ncbi:MAG: hypothetical protein JWL88_752 [Parcubacteria group bacterium]|nr:hypothetical protein [Parcubacteria group bacterium]
MENGLSVPETIEAHRKSFLGTHWRQALNAFLSDIWSGAADRRPILCFGDITLLREEGTTTYRLIGDTQAPVTIPRHLHDKILTVDAESTQIETGLARFVRNDRISCFGITFWKERKTFWLVKGEKRGMLYFGLHFAQR